MSFLASPTGPPHLKTSNIRPISIALAGIFTVLLVAQLFRFEELPTAIARTFINDLASSQILAAAIVTAELLAIPFLLRMRLSPAMRIVSMAMGWLSIGYWLVISLWKNSIGDTAPTTLLGATIELPEGWWSVFFCLACGVLIVWASWGMWPVSTKHPK